LKKLNDSTNRDDKVRRDWYREYGGITAPPVDHSGEFLPFHPDVHYNETPPFHGSEREREQRLEEMSQMASGELDYRNVPHFLGNSWEHPGLFIGALENKTHLQIPALNAPNASYLPQLPEGSIVEAPAEVKDGCIQFSKVIYLPGKTSELCLNQSQVAGMIATAAVEGNRDLAFEVIDTDIAITDKTAAKKALEKILKAHADILPHLQ